MARKYNHEAIIKLYNEGKSAGEIAEIMDMSQKNAWNAIKYLRKIKKISARRYRKIPEDIKREEIDLDKMGKIWALHNTGWWSDAEIAYDVKISVQKVREVLATTDFSKIREAYR